MLRAEDLVINRGLTADELRYHPDVDGQQFVIEIDLMAQAAIKATADFAVQIAQFKKWTEQGMAVLWDHVMHKNRSGAVGECLGAAYCQLLNQRVVKNPHESGSPDFFPLIKETKSYLETPTKDSYLDGGFDAKGCKIPDMSFMKIEASSHHRQTTTVLVTAWNYVKDVPQIIGCMFANDLNKDDWKISSIPKNDESKPTSSARLLPSGVDKLRRRWLFMHKSVRPPRSKKDLERYSLWDLHALRIEAEDVPS